MKLSILVCTSGRPTLTRTLASIGPQLLPGDELIVLADDSGGWGHPATNAVLNAGRLSGDYICFCDDDDVMTSQALAGIRATAQPALNIYRLHATPHDATIWQREEIVLGNVARAGLVVPNQPHRLARFGPTHHGDFDFARDTAEQWPVVWHHHVIGILRP